jgi:hypothetical protein
MSKRSGIKVALLSALVAGLATTDAQAAPQPITRDQIISIAKSGVNYSYWWGHGRWRNDGAQHGSCSGSCPSCSHSGSYGADCSGFVTKTWQIPGPISITQDAHPYSTLTFRYSSTYWKQINRGEVKRGDAFVYNTDGAGHIFLYESGDPWGNVKAYECKGCSYGCVYNLRPASSYYVPIRRDLVQDEPDKDGDGVGDSKDNCPAEPNAPQLDTDNDGKGDKCDNDDDGDGVSDTNDNCRLSGNAPQTNTDGDGKGDACDPDDDNDKVDDEKDNCPKDANGGQVDTDKDGKGDACDNDDDDDGVTDANDNCRTIKNAGQADADGDGKGDACETDNDGDGVLDADDNCKNTANSEQEDTDGDAKGDACDTDDDEDGIADASDNCPTNTNPDLADVDADGLGDVCDDDADGDAVEADGASDNCSAVVNPEQEDMDADGIGDACDDDLDGDSVVDTGDNCPTVLNTDQADADGDGIGDACNDGEAGEEGGTPVEPPPGTPTADASCGMQTPGSSRRDAGIAMFFVAALLLSAARRDARRSGN